MNTAVYWGSFLNDYENKSNEEFGFRAYKVYYSYMKIFRIYMAILLDLETLEPPQQSPTNVRLGPVFRDEEF